MKSAPTSPFAALRQLARPRKKLERCELCGAELPPEHDHLIDPPARRILCSCPACAMLFDGRPAARFRRIPRRVQFLPDFQMTDAMWESLHLPIDLVFFHHSTPAGRVIATYPSPAGATESLLQLESWRELVAANPVLAELQPDVEALLVNRVGGNHQYCRTPIDKCFQLVGLIRMHWRGLAGGTEVWGHIARFWQELQDQCPT